MAAHPRTTYTVAEYLAFERASETKHEYVAGELYAMAGAKEAHNLIVGNSLSWLRPQLRGSGCRIYASDMRVKVDALGIYTYPDLVVACGTPQLEDSGSDTLLNPVLLAEVLSPSTAAYDRGLKFRRYQLIPTFAEYLLIAQDRPLVELRQCQPDGEWTSVTYATLADTLTLTTISATLPLAAIYEDVAW